ncbi:WD40/YVTN/BNR-like repeat-containing protein [Lysobacter sp. F60174L2]|uniref:WD40/YVTN/BNR-like repeat-containing protein n=1 Tax=Lysobacter sp. F60174L2 TaxID=3459295 RepID=UPI00403DA762
MSISFRIAAGGMLLALAANAWAQSGHLPGVTLASQDSGVDVRLRGMSAVSDKVAWASGGDGTVLRTVDGGRQWQVIRVPGAAGLDFRDIEGVDANRAVVLSIGPGEASRVYRTADGGRSWQLAFQNRDPAAFLDCMAFDGAHGVILGDPVDGRFQVLETRDGGEHWALRDGSPKGADGEAAFAASGTCIALGGGTIVFVTGGARARAHYLIDAGDGEPPRWQATPAADTAPVPSAGYFSVASVPHGFIAVGGDYEQPDADGLLASLPKNPAPGVSATLGYREQPGPAGYRSGIACTGDANCIATGPSGTDWWNGEAWTAVSSRGFDAIDLVGGTGWASGEGGRIARITVGAADAVTADVAPVETAQASAAGDSGD